MLRRLSLAAFALLVAVPLAAQAPAGYMMRIDRSTDAADPDDNPEVKIAPVGSGFRVTTGPAVVLYNPSQTATGQYTLSGRFTLEQPSPPQANGNPHLNFYGLVFGGKDLNTANQTYIYFMVDFSGRYIIKHRAGDSATRAEDAQHVHTVTPATAHDAIRKPDASGRSVNDLEVRVGANEITYVVNGTVVATTPKSGMTGSTDGIYGVRINHTLPATVVENVRVTQGH
jgi:hypothetical protein